MRKEFYTCYQKESISAIAMALITNIITLFTTFFSSITKGPTAFAHFLKETILVPECHDLADTWIAFSDEAKANLHDGNHKTPGFMDSLTSFIAVIT